ncbi:EAL domain-containing protein [Colwellia sp. UCD-KL20]|uniref:EAL domain-containing protein n=1 Tax=Colwellia sp. UCD-KL20 TaxID=1917165 RepID=UPI0009706E94|nr:EAL domain-containing protein [Colwellia sp. UCD-KL20]
MRIISFLDQLCRTLKTFFLFFFISSIVLIVWFLGQNLWKLDHLSNIQLTKIPVKSLYLLNQKKQVDVNYVLNHQHLFQKKENIELDNQGEIFYWLKVKVKNTTAEVLTRVLKIDALPEEIISSYQIAVDIDKINKITRNHSVFQQVFPHIIFTIKPEESTTFLLQLKTAAKISPVKIFDAEHFNKRIHYSIAIFGAFIGIVLLMSIYNVVLFLSTKDKVYFTFLAYLLSAFLVFSTMNTYGYFIFSNDAQLWLNQHTSDLKYSLNICLIIFSLYFLQDNIIYKKQYKANMCFYLIGFVLLALGSNLLPFNNTHIALSIQSLLGVLCVFIVLQNRHKKSSWAKFYYISWLPFIVGSGTQHLLSTGYIASSFLSKNAFMLGVMAQIGFIILALAERMRKNEQNKLYYLSHHTQSGLPRQLNLVKTIQHLSQSFSTKQSFCVVVVQPEQIEKIKHYVDDSTVFSLFKRLNNSLSQIFKNNSAVIPLTLNNEKLCYIHGKCLGFIVNIDELDTSPDDFVQSIQHVISKTYTIKDLNLSLTGVIGIARYPQHGLISKDLVKNAVLAIRQAETTLEKWAFYQTHTPDKSTFLLELASDIQLAFQNNQFEIYHQPQIDLKTTKVCGSECLIRWKHPTQGYISPAIFIPVAEDMGLINKITLWVIKQSLTQHALIMEEYKNHMVSINISGIDLISKDFYREIIDILNFFTIPADKIIFEITESANIAKNEHAVEVIEKFTTFGITVSIDDFGTGYSSLANLDKLPFQELKIDKQFIDNIHHDNKRKVITETTVKMAKGVGLEVVAEGITTKEDESTLASFGCDIGQGYYYSEALPIQVYLKWLSEQVNGKISEDFYGEFIPASK